MAENNKKYRFETLQLHVGQDLHSLYPEIS